MSRIDPKNLVIRLIFVATFLVGVFPSVMLEWRQPQQIYWDVVENRLMLNRSKPIDVTSENIRDHVDIDFIKSLEGTSLTGYVPKQKGVPLGKSGVTVASGFDLGQRNEQDLRLLGLRPQLISKLRPYLGLKRWDADNFLKTNPLTLTKAEVDQINKAIFVTKVRGIIREVGETRWQAMSRGLRTVLASVQFQYGSARLKTPNFFRKVLSLDVTSVVNHLRNFGDKYRTRRNREANYLEQSLQNLNKKV